MQELNEIVGVRRLHMSLQILRRLPLLLSRNGSAGPELREAAVSTACGVRKACVYMYVHSSNAYRESG